MPPRSRWAGMNGPPPVDTLKAAVGERPAMSVEPAAGADAASDDDVWARETAPQSPYTTREVAIGLVVFAIAAVVAFVVPLLLA